MTGEAAGGAPDAAGTAWPGRPGSVERTVVFLDLVRFTTLTDVHGDHVAVEVLDRFAETVSGLLSEATRVVQRLGDGLLLVTTDPGTALDDATRAVEALHGNDRMPDTAGGIHHGPVVERAGEVYGATVNLAARLAELAAPGRLCVTRPVAERAATSGIAVEPLGPVELRGVVEPVELFSVAPCEHPHETVTDPVCGMRIAPGSGTPRRTTPERGFWFCGETCRGIFDRDPRRYTDGAGTRRLSSDP